MNNLPVLLVHIGGRFGGVLGWVLATGLLMLVLGLAFAERSKNQSRKD